MQPVRHFFLINSLLIGLPVEDLQNILEGLKEKGNAIALKKSDEYKKSRGQGGMFTVLAPISSDLYPGNRYGEQEDGKGCTRFALSRVQQEREAHQTSHRTAQKYGPQDIHQTICSEER